jgi:hypothetical protein
VHSWRGLAIAFAVLLASILAHLPMASLIAHYHVDYETAAYIILLITSGSVLLGILFPGIIVVIGTVRFLLAVFGTAFVIGW